MVGSTENVSTKKSSTKGMNTALSRRRVSCRELGRPDCDGWLWKKRRERGVFVTHKWQRFWFVLKGPALYWYTTQQDEKAEGFINISSYNIESAGEHKRKYVFKMFHPKFQNFFFAADHVSDMSKWINCLITAIQKHKKLQTGPSSEEECYSETESESERSPSPGRKNKKLNYNTYPRKKDKFHRAPLPSPPAEGGKGTGPVDEMGEMLNNIKEGGVSLTGQEQPFTYHHFRRSFIKRCKNPVINEKVHTLRTLHSTLKAKEAELLQINKLLDSEEVSAARFRQWRQCNEELLQDIERLALQRDRADHQPSPVSAETVTAATAEAQDEEEEEEEPEEREPGLTRSEGEGGERGGAAGVDDDVVVDNEQSVDGEPEESPALSPVAMATTTTAAATAATAAATASPSLELNLGSLQDSINRELSEMAESGEAEHYFYI